MSGMTHGFADWLAKEMPPGTVIGDPAWWADKIAARLRGDGEQSDGIRALPAKWRDEADEDNCHEVERQVLLYCATDLEFALAPPEQVAALSTQPAPSAPAIYSLDADPLGIRDRTAAAITGALAFGSQKTNAPPPGHWLQPFWDMARAEAEVREPPAPSEQVAASVAVPDEAIRQALVTHVPRVTDKKVETIIRYIRKLAAAPVAPEREAPEIQLRQAATVEAEPKQKRNETQ